MKTNLVSNLVSKVLSLAVLIAVTGPQANAAETCLNPNERAEYQALMTAKAEALANDPGCAKAYGAAGCVSPMDQARLRWFEARTSECFLGFGSELIGDWKVVARVCEGSGRPAKDAFEIGRDQMVMSFSRMASTDRTLRVAIRTQIENQQEYFTLGQAFPSPTEAGKVEVRVVSQTTLRNVRATVRFEITPRPTLILSTDGFGIGGSCAVGETLKTYLRK